LEPSDNCMISLPVLLLAWTLRTLSLSHYPFTPVYCRVCHYNHSRISHLHPCALFIPLPRPRARVNSAPLLHIPFLSLLFRAINLWPNTVCSRLLSAAQNILIWHAEIKKVWKWVDAGRNYRQCQHVVSRSNSPCQIFRLN
jgi:hypothetical protein